MDHDRNVSVFEKRVRENPGKFHGRRNFDDERRRTWCANAIARVSLLDTRRRKTCRPTYLSVSQAIVALLKGKENALFARVDNTVAFFSISLSFSLASASH